MKETEKEGDLCISPPKTLIFQSHQNQSHFEPGSKNPNISCRLLESRICLFNPSKKMLAFKVKVTNRQRYSVNPWIGLIKGDGEGEISITFRQPFPEDDTAAEEWLKVESERMMNDGVMVCWRSISQVPINEAKLAQVWEATPNRAIQCLILQCELQKMIEIPTRVMQRKKKSATSLREQVVTQVNESQSQNTYSDDDKECAFKTCETFQDEYLVNEESNITNVIDGSGDSANRRLTSFSGIQNEPYRGKTVSGSPSYTVVYDECRSSCQESCSTFEQQNNSLSSGPSSDHNEFDMGNRLTQSSRQRFLSRFLVNGVGFAAVFVTLTYGLRALQNIFTRIHKCIEEDVKDAGYFCKYTGLWCAPRDPVCEIVDQWKQANIFDYLQKFIESDARQGDVASTTLTKLGA